MEDIYCCKCERITSHREVRDDEDFLFGLECIVCGIVWEAEDPTVEIHVIPPLE